MMPVFTPFEFFIGCMASMVMGFIIGHWRQSPIVIVHKQELPDDPADAWKKGKPDDCD